MCVLRILMLPVAILWGLSNAHGQLTNIRPTQGLRGTTLDFVNVTSTRVISTVAELNGNEKVIAVGDFDNDGDPDIVIANGLSDFTQRWNKIYRNEAGTFVEISGTKIMPYFTDRDLSRAVALRDFDNDGWLDVVVFNDTNSGDDTRFYHNKHPGGVFSHFEEEPERFGSFVGTATGGAVAADVDNDGHCDLFMAGHPFLSQDRLLRNNSTGFFGDISQTHVPPDTDYATDAAAGDLNGDGFVDLLISNMFNDGSNVYYNHKAGQGSGPGDFRYDDSVQVVHQGFGRISMEPGDFNNDGLLDIYVSDHTPQSDMGTGPVDVILQNRGNDPTDKAIFAEVPILGFPSLGVSRKATAVDLDKDGRIDLVVMGHNRRPTVLRNTSVNHQLSFVDWTPANVFPNGNSFGGQHSAAIDATANGRPDIFLGGNSGDHLFENRPSATTKEAATNGMVPAIHNASPIAIFGNGVGGEVDVYSTANIPSGATVSVVLKSSVDLKLEAKTSGGTVIASSDRGGTAVEEAFQYTATPNGSLVVTFQGGSTAIRPYMLEILSRN